MMKIMYCAMLSLWQTRVCWQNFLFGCLYGWYYYVEPFGGQSCYSPVLVLYLCLAFIVGERDLYIHSPNKKNNNYKTWPNVCGVNVIGTCSAICNPQADT